MARGAFALTVNSATQGQGNTFSSAGKVADPLNSVATTTVAANVATLVADGASPTQGHVNTLNTNWTVLLAGTGTVQTGDVVLSYNITNVVSKSVLRRALRSLEKLVEGCNDLVE